MSKRNDTNLDPAVISDWLRRDRERRANRYQRVQLELPVPEALPRQPTESTSAYDSYDYNTGVNCGVVVDLLG